MLKPNPIIEIEVRIHAISVLSAAISVRWTPRSVRSSARSVALSFGACSTRFMATLLCARKGALALELQRARTQPRQNQVHQRFLSGPFLLSSQSGSWSRAIRSKRAITVHAACPSRNSFVQAEMAVAPRSARFMALGFQRPSNAWGLGA